MGQTFCGNLGHKASVTKTKWSVSFEIQDSLSPKLYFFRLCYPGRKGWMCHIFDNLSGVLSLWISSYQSLYSINSNS